MLFCSQQYMLSMTWLASIHIGNSGAEGNTNHPSRVSYYEVLDEYLDFDIEDVSNLDQSTIFSPTAVSTDLQSGTFELLVDHLGPVTEQQVANINNLEQSTHHAEDALSLQMEALQESMANTLVNDTSGTEGSSGNRAKYMCQMANAMGKLVGVEGFLLQADNLRQETLQQMQHLLTTGQAARALLVAHDYYSRLGTLGTLWLTRPRE